MNILLKNLKILLLIMTMMDLKLLKSEFKYFETSAYR